MPRGLLKKKKKKLVFNLAFINEDIFFLKKILMVTYNVICAHIKYGPKSKFRFIYTPL
jgi:hypothetical protein